MSKLNQDQIDNLWKLIKESSKITLLTHFKPDGDGIAACAAFDLILTRLGKQTETVYPTQPEFEFKRQPEKIFINEHHLVPDLLIVLDTANFGRFYYPKEFEGISLINIDHHVSNSITGTYNVIYPDTSSTCEILYNIFSAWNEVVIDKPVAEVLLFGILYDSRVFHTQATHPSTLRIAADLMERGADLFQLKVELLAHKDPKIVKLWELMLSRITISQSKKAVWSYLTQEDLKQFGLTLSSLIGFNDFLSDISDVDVTILFYETEEGLTKVSLRSKKYDVNKLAAKFGGGGHKNAAGILSDTQLNELMKAVIAKIR